MDSSSLPSPSAGRAVVRSGAAWTGLLRVCLAWCVLTLCARGQEAGVQAPQLPTVVSIEVLGAERYTPAQLEAALGQRVGAKLDQQAIDVGLKNLWSSFRVRARVEQRQAGEGQVELRLTVIEMTSDREPRFFGNVKIDTKTLRRWALLEDETELYVYRVPNVKRRLLEGYRREGFYFVEINDVQRDFSGDDARSAVDVILEIREGPKVRVSGVEVRGNDSMPDRGFWIWKEGISAFSKRELSGPSLTNWRGSPFVQEVLEADLLAMRQIYRQRGWLDAVVEIEDLVFNANRSRVKVIIRIDEGEPYTVTKMGIEAFEYVEPTNTRDDRLKPAEDGLLFDEDELLELCKIRVGEAFEERLIAGDSVQLRRFYGDEGYIDHSTLPRGTRFEFLDPELVVNPDDHTVQVHYRIVQGRTLRLRDIVFEGTTHTRDRVLRREVSVFPGGKADLTEINRSLVRIQGTGYFTNDFRPQDHIDPYYEFVPIAGDPEHVDLRFVVAEGRVVDFNITGGVDSNNGAFGLVSLTMRNFDASDWPSSFAATGREIFDKEAFHGAGQRLDLEIAPGTELSRFRLHFAEPDIFKRHLKPISLDLDLLRRLRIFDSHDEDRTEKRITFGRRLNFDTAVSLGFLHADVNVDDLDEAGVPQSLTDQAALGDSVLAGPTLGFSTRSVDNLVNTREGFFLRANATYYEELFGSDFDFVELRGNYDYFVPAWTKEDGTRAVLHFELDAGVAEPLGGLRDIPFSERFFLGGSRTLRGFDFRGVGPNDPASGFALGGETFVSGSVELLYPLYSVVQPGTYNRIESVRGVLFFDWGILDPEALSLDVDELRTTVGFGIGLAHPIPIILNFGFPVRDQDGDEREVFSFSIGPNR